MLLDELRNAVAATEQAEDEAIRFIEQLKLERDQLKADNDALRLQLAQSDEQKQAIIDGFIGRLTATNTSLRAVVQ